MGSENYRLMSIIKTDQTGFFYTEWCLYNWLLDPSQAVVRLEYNEKVD